MNERDRTNTVYYDAQPNFGTPPKDQRNDFKHGLNRNPSNPVNIDNDGIYEHVHTERRHHYSFQKRDPGQSSSMQGVNRSPISHVRMSPMSTSYDYQAAAGDPRWIQEDFKPGPRTNSAANIDSLFNKQRTYSGGTGGSHLPPAPRREYSGGRDEAHLVYVRRAPDAAAAVQRRNKDFGVIGAYSNDPSFRADQIMHGRSGPVRPHDHDYELDPRLNVTYPQYYVDDWKERHSDNAQRPSINYENAISMNRPRFSSDSNRRHFYDEVPIGNVSSGYRKQLETAILDDYDNVPQEFEDVRKNIDKQRNEETHEDAKSDVYEPGRYQPSEDAGSSSDEDDPEYLELMERDSIINRYEKGPDSADIDAWENPEYDVYEKMDRFGFVHKESVKREEPSQLQKRRILKESSREKKWLKMIQIWKSGGPSKKMDDRIWKGIPATLRLAVWPRLLGAEQVIREKKNVYSEILLRARLVSKDIKQIDLDINRTYRDHLAFRKRYDVKQKSLLNVLAAYSMYNTEVGYCQGMSQIAALFLMYLDEEATFWCLHQLMVSPKHTMHGFFVPGFPKLQRFEEHFKKVLKKYRPKIYKHLEKQDIPYIYLTKWWFGCFLDRVPFSLALRLWDVFLIEGDPVLIAMALNIMKMHEKTIRKLNIESFMEFIQNDIANNFGYSDDETMHSLRETIVKLKSDRQHVPPPPRPEDLSEVPTKALGPILQKPMASIREEIHDIQSRRSRANSTGRSPHPKRKESSRNASKGPPPVVHRWSENASEDSVNNGRNVPFEIPTRRIGSPSAGDSPFSNGNSSKRDHVNSSASPRYNYNQNSSRSGRESAAGGTPSMQRLRDERNGQMVLLSRASDSEGDGSSPIGNKGWHESKMSTSSNSSGRIMHAANHVTRIELDGDVSVI